jgi:hypothetical protein
MALATPLEWYVPRALRRGRLSWGAVIVATATGVSACGGGARQDATEPNANFPVQVAHASFPTQQRLAEHTDLVLTIRNTGTKTIPDIAVTITNPAYGTAAQAFGTLLAKPAPGQPILAGRSRPVWVVDRPPGPCQYSCQQGGPGGAVTANSNTWALGRLGPGQTARFEWGVTAVQSGSYTVHYVVAAGLGGKAKAVRAQGGGRVEGDFHVKISQKPRQAYVANNGQIVYSGG